MEDRLFGIDNMDAYLVLGILVFFVIIETIAGYMHRTNRNFGDWLEELGGFLMLSLFTKPAIVLAVLGLGSLLLPNLANAVADVSIWIVLPIYLLLDDVLQYWYHRSAHEYDFLWKLHRTHHQAEEMGFFISYRNAFLYYILMPNLWWVGIATFLGAGLPVAIALILKQIIIISSHSTLSYDKIMYDNKILRPFILLWERIFITPAFHHAHHGKTKLDGVSDPNGNFGNMFSLWDQLFGTAKFSHAFPTEYGLENDPQEHWSVAYLYPAVKSSDKQSEMSANYKKENTSTNEPITVKLEAGQSYLYCACGMSKNQPFCDSSHHGTKHKPVLFEAKRTGEVRLCNCKKTKASPFCDDSHINLT